MKKIGIKVLVVEDMEDIQQIYADELRAQGYVVFTASNGREGLEIALREQPDLIVLDILMPMMDGLTMMSKLRRENLYGQRVSVILLTCLSSFEKTILEKISKYKPDFYLIKNSTTLEELTRKVNKLLRPDNGNETIKLEE